MLGKPRPFLNSHLLVGVLSVLAALIVEKFIEKIPPEAFLVDCVLVASLVALSIVVAGIVTKVEIESLIDTTKKAARDEIETCVSGILSSHAHSIEALTRETERAGKILQISIPESPLYLHLLTVKEIRHREEAAQDEVYVVLRDLAFDRSIDTTVKKNLNDGISYFYFYPDGSITERAMTRFKDDLGLNPSGLACIHFIKIKKEQFNFPTDMVIYDPHRTTSTGYVRLPFEEKPGGIRAIFIEKNPRLNSLAEFLSSLIDEWRNNGQPA